MIPMPERRTPRHPGRILEEDFLSRLPDDATQADVADRLGISRPRLNELIRGKRGVTPDTALRLARAFGTRPELWLDAQAAWDLYQARRQRRRMREIDEITPWRLEEAAAPGASRAPAGPQGVNPTAEVLATVVDGEREVAAGRAAYYEEFLEKRGLLAEARRYAKIQAQLDALEPGRAAARGRLVRLNVPAAVLFPPVLPRTG